MKKTIATMGLMAMAAMADTDSLTVQKLNPATGKYELTKVPRRSLTLNAGPGAPSRKKLALPGGLLMAAGGMGIVAYVLSSMNDDGDMETPVTILGIGSTLGIVAAGGIMMSIEF
jgi:hypothetical protein